MKNFKVKGEIIMEPRSVKFVVQDEKGKDRVEPLKLILIPLLSETIQKQEWEEEWNFLL